jgi:hypothetical protein
LTNLLTHSTPVHYCIRASTPTPRCWPTPSRTAATTTATAAIVLMLTTTPAILLLPVALLLTVLQRPKRCPAHMARGRTRAEHKERSKEDSPVPLCWSVQQYCCTKVCCTSLMCTPRNCAALRYTAHLSCSGVPCILGVEWRVVYLIPYYPNTYQLSFPSSLNLPTAHIIWH